MKHPKTNTYRVLLPLATMADPTTSDTAATPFGTPSEALTPAAAKPSTPSTGPMNLDPVMAMMNQSSGSAPRSRGKPGRRKRPTYVGTGLSKGAAAPTMPVMPGMEVPKGPAGFSGMNCMVPSTPVKGEEEAPAEGAEGTE